MTILYPLFLNWCITFLLLTIYFRSLPCKPQKEDSEMQSSLLLMLHLKWIIFYSHRSDSQPYRKSYKQTGRKSGTRRSRPFPLYSSRFCWLMSLCASWNFLLPFLTFMSIAYFSIPCKPEIFCSGLAMRKRYNRLSSAFHPAFRRPDITGRRQARLWRPYPYWHS